MDVCGGDRPFKLRRNFCVFASRPPLGEQIDSWKVLGWWLGQRPAVLLRDGGEGEEVNSKTIQLETEFLRLKSLL